MKRSIIISLFVLSLVTVTACRAQTINNNDDLTRALACPPGSAYAFRPSINAPCNPTPPAPILKPAQIISAAPAPKLISTPAPTPTTISEQPLPQVYGDLKLCTSDTAQMTELFAQIKHIDNGVNIALLMIIIVMIIEYVALLILKK